MKTSTFVDKQYEAQIVDQYLSGDTACRVFATLEYYTYRSINSHVPGIFAKYNGKNNSGMTKTLDQLKRQLKTHVLSFLASHQDMINSYGIYPYPNNFTEKDAKKFILTCEKLVKDPEVKIHCKNLIAIINKDYQTVLNYYLKIQKKNKPEMDPKIQVKKFMPAIGISIENKEKANQQDVILNNGEKKIQYKIDTIIKRNRENVEYTNKLAQEGKYEHKIDINEIAKKKMEIQGSFINILDCLRYYSSALLSDEELQKNLEDFYNEFKENDNIFEYPNGYSEKTTRTILARLSQKNENLRFFCLIVNCIISRDYNSAKNMLLY